MDLLEMPLKRWTGEEGWQREGEKNQGGISRIADRVREREAEKNAI